jgi:hypothetical protein
MTGKANESDDSTTPGQPSSVMEVHHSHKHGTRKWKDYLSEFAMIFLAVTAGFFAETLREHIGDGKKEKEYMVSMIADLKEDTADINQITKILFKNIRGQDSLILLLKSFHESDSSAKKAYRYYLRYTIGVPQVIFNEGTITQLLGSGNMHLVSDHAIADSITDYTNYVKYNKVQAGYYNDQFKQCFDYSTNLFDFTVARNPLQENFQRAITVPIRLDTLHLLSHDPAQLQKYCNELTMLQSIINGYVLNLRFANRKAGALIALLQKKYGLD